MTDISYKPDTRPLLLVRGDTYDDIANPKLRWPAGVTGEGWAAVLTIRGEDDAVVLSTTGEIADGIVAVSITGPDGVPFKGCPGIWQGKYDVQLSKGESRRTVALGKCYVSEDQTR